MINLKQTRCFGGENPNSIYAQYHDNEWGVPVYDDRLLFEMLILEGAQAGLNFETILKKREGYREAFYQFDMNKVSNMKDQELEGLRSNPSIIRNRLKILSARINAKIFIQIQNEFGSFSKYLWDFVGNRQIVNNYKFFKDVPTQTKESELLSKDLKKRGMKFVGPTIMYAYMQAVGLTDDHLESCLCRNNLID